MGWIILGLFLASVGWIVWIIKGNNTRIRRNFVSLGERFGLEVDSSRKFGLWAHPVAEGTFEGMAISICSTVTSTRQKVAFTKIRVTPPTKREFSFGFTRNTSTNRMIRKHRYPDGLYETKDAVFDGKVLCVTNDPTKLERLLEHGLRASIDKLLPLGAKDGFVTYDGTSYSYDLSSLINHEKKRLLVEELILTWIDLDARF